MSDQRQLRTNLPLPDFRKLPTTMTQRAGQMLGMPPPPALSASIQQSPTIQRVSQPQPQQRRHIPPVDYSSRGEYSNVAILLRSIVHYYLSQQQSQVDDEDDQSEEMEEDETYEYQDEYQVSISQWFIAHLVTIQGYLDRIAPWWISRLESARSSWLWTRTC